MHYTTNPCGVILHNVTKSTIWGNAIASVVSLSLLQIAKENLGCSCQGWLCLDSDSRRVILGACHLEAHALFFGEPYLSNASLLQMLFDEVTTHSFLHI